jgi:spermidine/putrescine transport system permease protein
MNKIFTSKIILIIFFLFFYLPIGNILYQSFLVDGVITLGGYLKLFLDLEVMSSFLTSIFIALLTSFITLYIAIQSIKYFFLSGSVPVFVVIFNFLNLILPEVVLALALFIFYNYFSLSLGYVTLIISHVAFSLAYALPLLNQKWHELNKVYITVAYDLGADNEFIWKTIIIKLLRPTIITLSFLIFVLSFDDYIFSYFCAGVESLTLSNRLMFYLKNGLTHQVKCLYGIIFFFSLLLAVIFIIHTVKNNEQ